MESPLKAKKQRTLPDIQEKSKDFDEEEAQLESARKKFLVIVRQMEEKAKQR